MNPLKFFDRTVTIGASFIAAAGGLYAFNKIQNQNKMPNPAPRHFAPKINTVEPAAKGNDNTEEQHQEHGIKESLI